MELDEFFEGIMEVASGKRDYNAFERYIIVNEHNYNEYAFEDAADDDWQKKCSDYVEKVKVAAKNYLNADESLDEYTDGLCERLEENEKFYSKQAKKLEKELAAKYE